MVLETVDLVLVGVLLIISLWRLYNVPILATGVKDFRESRQKPQKKVSQISFHLLFQLLSPLVQAIKSACWLIRSMFLISIDLLRRAMKGTMWLSK